MSVGRPINEPGPVAIDSSRRSAPEILSRVAESARGELNRSSRALALSGLAGGLTMGLTGLSVAVVRSTLGFGDAFRVHVTIVSLLNYGQIRAGQLE